MAARALGWNRADFTHLLSHIWDIAAIEILADGTGGTQFPHLLKGQFGRGETGGIASGVGNNLG